MHISDKYSRPNGIFFLVFCSINCVCSMIECLVNKTFIREFLSFLGLETLELFSYVMIIVLLTNLINGMIGLDQA